MADSINTDLLESFFEDANDVLQEWEKVTLGMNPGDDVKVYEPILRCAHNLKGSAGMVGLHFLNSKIHRIEDFLVKLRDLGLGPDERVVAVLLQTEQLLRRWVDQIKIDPGYVEDTRLLEEEMDSLTGGQSGGKGANSSAAASSTPAPAPVAAAKNVESLRVSVAKLDHLIQLVGEISLQQSIVDRAAQDGILDTAPVRSVIDLKSKLTQDLRDAALSLRMIPVGGLFQKIERTVVDAARALNKQVRVVREGDDVSLDKLVVEGMLDPLIHIARNAVDHGIESVVERVGAGKEPYGMIKMSAENNAGGVTLHFLDDGRGIDHERVFRKAVERGFVGENEPMSNSAKLDLIFTPGLSTAQEVTAYSGRGIGMDVVAESLKKMGGRIEIQSAVDQGTRFTIYLPTNLSILDALVVRAGGCQYAVPNQDLIEAVDLRDFALTRSESGEGYVINLRGRTVPVELLSHFLDRGQGEARVAPAGAKPRPGLIVMYRDEVIAMEVEEISGQQQIFVRPLTGHLSPIGFYGGSTILSDGEPTIILNLPEMARLYFTSH